MIPQQDVREVRTAGAVGSAKFGISAKNSSHIMTILRDTLYSDKIMAVLREYGANAWDANRMAGRGDKPITVQLPTTLAPELRIRDYGDGLSPDEIREIYTQYGESTKRESNDGVGMLGIGSKSGFAYADSFTVTSWHGGMKRIYIAVIDETNEGRIDLMHEEPAGPDETGLEIQIAIKPADFGAFQERAHRLFVHFEPLPEINIPFPTPAARCELKLGAITETANHWDSGGKWIAVMGCVPYRVDIQQLRPQVVDGVSYVLTNSARNVGGVMRFPVGDLQIAASREELKYGDATQVELIKRINGLINEYVDTLLKDIDTVSDWEKRKRIRSISGKQLPVPSRFKDLDRSYVDVGDRYGIKSTSTPQAVGQARLMWSHRDYNSRMKATYSIQVERDSRLVVKDEHRAMVGYAFQPNDVLVSIEGMTGSLINGRVTQKLLDAEVQRLKIGGIPIVKLSSIKWTAPLKADGKPRDPARARAKSFVLNPNATFDDMQRSSLWDPVNRVPSDTDVFVVLDNYRAQNMDTFYESYREDEKTLKEVGLKMPPVYGYKTTKADPVVASKKKGVEYRTWRTQGMLKMILGTPEVAAVVQALGFYNPSTYLNFDVPLLQEKLGEGHPIVAWATAEISGRNLMSKTSTAKRTVANTVKVLMKSEELESTKLRKKIVDMYPLLATVQMDVFRESNKNLWVDYVKLVDSTKKTQEEAKEEAAA